MRSVKCNYGSDSMYIICTGLYLCSSSSPHLILIAFDPCRQKLSAETTYKSETGWRQCGRDSRTWAVWWLKWWVESHAHRGDVLMTRFFWNSRVKDNCLPQFFAKTTFPLCQICAHPGQWGFWKSGDTCKWPRDTKQSCWIRCIAKW